MEIISILPQLGNMGFLQALKLGLIILTLAPFVGAFVYIVFWFKKKASK